MHGSVRFSRLVFLWIYALAAASAADLEFSHKLHLGKVGLTCTFCHSAAVGSQAVTDNNLPEQQLCLACHNGETAPSIDASTLADRTPAERVFWFNHQQHLALGNPAPTIAKAIDSGKYLGHAGDIRERLDTDNACMACHRGLAEADQVDSKLHLPRMSDCLVCHDQIDNPFSCEECHPRDFAIKPASHTRGFIDGHSTGKMGFDKLTCQPCHGRNFRCMGCH
jgi:c(7)-type cytochrome triheme protein